MVVKKKVKKKKEKKNTYKILLENTFWYLVSDLQDSWAYW